MCPETRPESSVGSELSVSEAGTGTPGSWLHTRGRLSRGQGLSTGGGLNPAVGVRAAAGSPPLSSTWPEAWARCTPGRVGMKELITVAEVPRQPSLRQPSPESAQLHIEPLQSTRPDNCPRSMTRGRTPRPPVNLTAPSTWQDHSKSEGSAQKPTGSVSPNSNQTAPSSRVNPQTIAAETPL